MPSIRIRQFSGLAPRFSPKILPDAFSQFSQDTNLLSSECRPWLGPKREASAKETDEVKTIYEIAGHWFTWTQDVDVVRSPIANNPRERHYYTGDGYPKVTDLRLSGTEDVGYSGKFPKANGFYAMGVTKPDITWGTTVSGTATGAPTVTQYLATYETAWGQESAASNLSDQVNFSGGQSIAITGIPAKPTGQRDANITKLNLYRLNADGAGGAVYQRVTSITLTNAAQTYTDTTENRDLGNALVSANYDVPPDDMQGLIALPNGVLAGFTGNQLCFSYPYEPHAWPVSYRLSFDQDIVAIGHDGTTVVVTTHGFPYSVTLQDPSTVSVTAIPAHEPCTSKRGLVSTEYGVIYPTPNGLYRIRGTGGGDLLTRQLYTRKEWADFNPETIHAYTFNDRYVGYYRTAEKIYGARTSSIGSGFFLEIQDNPPLTTLSHYATAGYVDEETSQLFYCHDVENEAKTGVTPQIERWNALEYNSPEYIWKSKVYVTDYPVNFAAIKIETNEEERKRTAVNNETIDQEEIDLIIAANQLLLDEGDLMSINGQEINGDSGGSVNGDPLDDVPVNTFRDYRVEVVYYGDYIERYRQVITKDGNYRLPCGFKALNHEISISGTAWVQEVHLSTSMQELMDPR